MAGPSDTSVAATRLVVRIQPARAWQPLHVHELWQYRDVFLFLAWRDISLRYKQTSLGVAWIVLQPLMTAGVLAVFLGRWIGVPSAGIPYTLFAFIGLMPWTFFSKAVAQSTASVVGSASLITKVYFPRVLIPAATVAAGVLDLVVTSVLAFVLLFAYGRPVPVTVLWLPPLMVLTAVLAFAIGLLLSAVNVKYRDVAAVVPVALQLWMFATPIIYPLSVVPRHWHRILDLNPLAGIVEGFRAALLGGPFPVRGVLFAVATSCALLLVAVLAFRRMESSFADIV